jgi:sporulation protein YlmC with PRC-barrel domain
MSVQASGRTLRAQRLMGRRVRDHQDHHLGRVYELEVSHVGDELCVTALLLGPGSWLTRFGWTGEKHGRRVPWSQIETLDPIIRLRAGGDHVTR